MWKGDYPNWFSCAVSLIVCTNYISVLLYVWLLHNKNLPVDSNLVVQLKGQNEDCLYLLQYAVVE